jgi:hypothetical protein
MPTVESIRDAAFTDIYIFSHAVPIDLFLVIAYIRMNLIVIYYNATLNFTVPSKWFHYKFHLYFS